MKKALISLLLIVGTFALTGCVNDEPGLKLNGESEITLTLGDEFEDPGVVIVGDYDVEVKTESDVDLTTPGSYKVTYSFEYDGKEYSVTRTVIITEDGSVITPGIALVGESEVEIKLNESFEDPGAKIVGDFDLTISTESNLDITTPGTYTITYSIVYDGVTYNVTRTVEVVETTIPEITLNGDSEVFVNLYEDYEDLGVDVSEGFDLEVNMAGEVLTHTLGDYELVYSVEYEGVTYSVTRMVHVIDYDAYLGEIGLSLTPSTREIDALSVVVDYEDNTNISELYLVLYDGDQELNRIDVSEVSGEYTFDELTANSLYQIRLEGIFDNETVSFEIPEMYLDLMTYSSVTYSIRISDEIITPYTYDALITLTDDFDVISNVTLELYNVTWDESMDIYVMSEDVYTFDLDNIYEEEEYLISITYTFTNPNTGEQEERKEVLTTFSTPALPVPEITTNDCASTLDSITCTVLVNEDNSSNITIAHYLYKGNDFIAFDNVSNGASMEFTDLDSSTTYTIETYITFTDIESGTTYQVVKLIEQNIDTATPVMNTTPTVENMEVVEDMLSSTKSITFNFDIVDPDSTITGTRVLEFVVNGSTYRKAVVVGSNSIVFTTGVIENTEYTYKVVVDYIPYEGEYLNRQILFEDTIVTTIDMTISDFYSSDTLWYQEHGVFEIKLNNSVGAEIDSIVVNGTVMDNVLFLSTKTHLFVDFGVMTNVSNQIFTIEGVNITLEDGTSKYIETTKTLEDIIYERGAFVPDDATIEVIEITTSDYTVVTDNTDPTMIDISLYIENEFNLQIDSVTIGGEVFNSSEFTYNGNYLVISVEVDLQLNNYKLTSISYTRNQEQLTYYEDALSGITVYGYESEDVVYINTVADFMSMQGDGKYYILQADLDFDGVLYTPIGTISDSFNGCFDGNGFTISNLSITDSTGVQNTSKYVGLFGVSSGLILNVKLDNVTITTNTPNIDQYIYAGVLSGKHYGTVYNVNVQNSVMNINGLEAGYVGGIIGYFESYHGRIKDSNAEVEIIVDALNYTTEPGYILEVGVGGIVGLLSRSDIETTHSSGSIIIHSIDNGQAFHVGGLVGIMNGDSDYNKNYILNSYSSVSIDVENTYYGTIGGLAGRTGNIEFYTVIMNSYSTGDIHTTAGKIGGLAGVASEIINSMSFGDLYDIGGSPGAITGSSSYVYETLRDHQFVYENQDYYNSGILTDSTCDSLAYNFTYVPEDVLNTEEFFTIYLNFSDHLFDFSTLDVENNLYPTLK